MYIGIVFLCAYAVCTDIPQLDGEHFARSDSAIHSHND